MIVRPLIYVIILGSLVSAALSGKVCAQPHLSPRHGEPGVPGPFPRSFIIEWGAVPGAVAYEYVLSDNPLCFAGCPGDTRQQKVTGTSAVEYNLQEDVWYYWITRVYMNDGEISVWTGITSFLALTPEPYSEIVQIAPNPAHERLKLYVDWGVSPVSLFVTAEIYDLLGRRLAGPITFHKSSPRFEIFDLPIPALPKGNYIGLFLLDGNPNNPNNRVTQKFVFY